MTWPPAHSALVGMGHGLVLSLDQPVRSDSLTRRLETPFLPEAINSLAAPILRQNAYDTVSPMQAKFPFLQVCQTG